MLNPLVTGYLGGRLAGDSLCGKNKNRGNPETVAAAEGKGAGSRRAWLLLQAPGEEPLSRNGGAASPGASWSHLWGELSLEEYCSQERRMEAWSRMARGR